MTLTLPFPPVLSLSVGEKRQIINVKAPSIQKRKRTREEEEEEGGDVIGEALRTLLNVHVSSYSYVYL